MHNTVPFASRGHQFFISKALFQGYHNIASPLSATVKSRKIKFTDLPDPALLCILQTLCPDRDAVSLGHVCHKLKHRFPRMKGEPCSIRSVRPSF